MADDTGSKHDVIRLSRHLLNHAATNQTISKQECMLLVGGLDLVKCSETIETVSISGQYCIQPGKTNTLFKQYEKCPALLHHLSLDQFFIMCTTEEAMLLFRTMLVDEANLCIQLLRDMHEPVL
jgi:hypothetical protein